MILSVEDERNDSMKWNIGLLEWNQELNIDIGMNSINMNTGWLIMIYWIQDNVIVWLIDMWWILDWIEWICSNNEEEIQEEYSEIQSV